MSLAVRPRYHRNESWVGEPVGVRPITRAVRTTSSDGVQTLLRLAFRNCGWPTSPRRVAGMLVPLRR